MPCKLSAIGFCSSSATKLCKCVRTSNDNDRSTVPFTFVWPSANFFDAGLGSGVRLFGGSSPKQTHTTEMLSALCRLNASSANCFAAMFGSLFTSKDFRAKSTAFCDENTSHKPSHAKIKNSSFSTSISHVSISGSAVNGPGLPVSSSLFKPSKCQSPKARLTPNKPLTYPSSIKPPAFFILSSSSLEEGFWSRVKSCAIPLLLTTHLESPALATINLPSNKHAVHAVDPLVSISSSFSSSSKNPSFLFGVLCLVAS
mmetsp:Transcript_8361/g.26770  ORF Transcript_8361/g.26770 Transcript_8361/m.26770 type:complete len:257 (-) Transcript_8361:820-1590(-)